MGSRGEEEANLGLPLLRAVRNEVVRASTEVAAFRQRAGGASGSDVIGERTAVEAAEGGE